MKIITHDVTINKENPFCLIPLSDIHMGHADHDADFAKKTVAWIKEKGASVILLGDMIDGIAQKDRRFENNSIATNFKKHLDNLHQHQVDELVKLLYPIRKQIISTMAGNHEDTVHKYFTWDPTIAIAKGLGIENKILTDPGYVVLRFDHNGSKRLISILCTHGQFMGGRKRGCKVNRMEDLASDFSADIYLAGHTHDLFVTRSDSIGLSRSGKYETRRQYFINTGSMMDTYSEHGESTWASRKLFPPNKPGVARIDFYGKKKNNRRYIDIHTRT
jgi:predicted phosphodiesterase